MKQRTRKKDKRGRSRRTLFSIAALLIVLVGLLAGWFLLAQREVSFEEAMKKPELREDYIEKIVEEIGRPEYVVAINYVDTQEEIELLKKEYGFIPVPDVLKVAHSEEEIQIDQIGKRPIFIRISVFPYAFSGEILKTENDFISSLRHEYRHAKVLQENRIGWIEIFPSFLTVRGEWNENLLYDIMELDAFRMEIIMRFSENGRG